MAAAVVNRESGFAKLLCGRVFAFVRSIGSSVLRSADHTAVTLDCFRFFVVGTLLFRAMECQARCSPVALPISARQYPLFSAFHRRARRGLLISGYKARLVASLLLSSSLGHCATPDCDVFVRGGLDCSATPLLPVFLPPVSTLSYSPPPSHCIV